MSAATTLVETELKSPIDDIGDLVDTFVRNAVSIDPDTVKAYVVDCFTSGLEYVKLHWVPRPITPFMTGIMGMNNGGLLFPVSPYPSLPEAEVGLFKPKSSLDAELDRYVSEGSRKIGEVSVDLANAFSKHFASYGFNHIPYRELREIGVEAYRQGLRYAQQEYRVASTEEGIVLRPSFDERRLRETLIKYSLPN